MTDEPLFFIWASDDKTRDEALWWNPKACGYTYNLDRAGRYTAEQVERYAGHVRTTQIPIPVADALEFSHRQVKAHTLESTKIRFSALARPSAEQEVR